MNTKHTYNRTTKNFDVEPITFKINKALIKKGLTVTENQVLKAINYAYKNLGLVIEPGGAVALAAILNNKTNIKAEW